MLCLGDLQRYKIQNQTNKEAINYALARRLQIYFYFIFCLKVLYARTNIGTNEWVIDNNFMSIAFIFTAIHIINML